MKTLSINISAISFVFITAVMVFGCKKYERDNPNDVLGIAKGNSTIAFNDYKITDDISGDGKLQKLETGKLWLSLKNTGQKISSQIRSIQFSSKANLLRFTSSPIILNNYVLVGKQDYNVVVDFKASDIQVTENKVEVTATMNLLDGTTSVVTFNVEVIPIKTSKLSIQSLSIRSFDQYSKDYVSYTKGQSPVLTILLRNNSTDAYNGKLRFGVSHVGSTYSFNSIAELQNVNLAPGQLGVYNVKLSCFPTELPDNYISLCDIGVYDQDSGFVKWQYTLNHSPYPYTIAEISDRYYPFVVGQPFSVELSVYKYDDEDTLTFFQQGATLTGRDGLEFENVKIEVLKSVVTGTPGTSATIAFRITGIFKKQPNLNNGYMYSDLEFLMAIGNNCPFKKKFELISNYSY